MMQTWLALARITQILSQSSVFQAKNTYANLGSAVNYFGKKPTLGISHTSEYISRANYKNTAAIGWNCSNLSHFSPAFHFI